MSDSAHARFETALAEVPAPLRAAVANHWQALAPHLPALLAASSGHEWLGRLPRVFAASDFAAQACAQQPDVLRALLASGDLARAYADGELATRVNRALEGARDEADLKMRLRQVRRREMLRIAYRDLAGWANLGEVMATLSELADSCIDSALVQLARWLQAPPGFVVLGMGKLGGRELNFSSDVDLIFAYADDVGGGETANAPNQMAGRTSEASRASESTRSLRLGPIGEGEASDHHEQFVRLAQKLVQALSEATADGFVFRVDLRLRPHGTSGPLAVSFDAMENYYQAHGREWERYALIKARVVAGARGAGEDLLARLRPFVFRKYLDYGAIESLRGMKTLIEREVARKGMRHNVKLGPGGIREIEFIAQALQLIRGGREPQLQERALLPVLDRLVTAGHLESAARARCARRMCSCAIPSTACKWWPTSRPTACRPMPSARRALPLPWGLPTGARSRRPSTATASRSRSSFPSCSARRRARLRRRRLPGWPPRGLPPMMKNPPACLRPPATAGRKTRSPCCAACTRVRPARRCRPKAARASTG